MTLQEFQGNFTKAKGSRFPDDLVRAWFMTFESLRTVWHSSSEQLPSHYMLCYQATTCYTGTWDAAKSEQSSGLVTVGHLRDKRDAGP